MPDNSRPKVGPADEETRRRMLHEKLEEPTRAEGVAPGATPVKPKKKKGFMQDLADALDPSKPRERTVEGKNKTISDAVDEGIVEGDRENRVKK